MVPPALPPPAPPPAFVPAPAGTATGSGGSGNARRRVSPKPPKDVEAMPSTAASDVTRRSPDLIEHVTRMATPGRRLTRRLEARRARSTFLPELPRPPRVDSPRRIAAGPALRRHAR